MDYYKGQMDQSVWPGISCGPFGNMKVGKWITEGQMDFCSISENNSFYSN